MNKKKSISLLGSTGSIGTQTLSVVSLYPEKFEVKALSCNRDVGRLAEQITAFKPEAVAVEDEHAAAGIAEDFPSVKLYAGRGAAEALAEDTDCDVVLNALVGIDGLMPTVKALARRPAYLALANKESLVAGGRAVTDFAASAGVPIVPVDSEHSAIFQCLQGYPGKAKRLILTCSGGPFRGMKREELADADVAKALKHPNWDMGLKVTIDSATLMNKGLEVIEAARLFGMSHRDIDVVIHPQSIVHSLVEFEDGAQLAQLGLPEMRVPISYALTYPERYPTGVAAPSLTELGELTFEKPDRETFLCLRLAYDALRRADDEGDEGAPAYYVTAGQVLTEAFACGRISFMDIGDLLGRSMAMRSPAGVTSIQDILRLTEEARSVAMKLIDETSRSR